MKLVGEAFGFQRLEDCLHAIGHKKRRPRRALGQKISNGPVERTRHAHRLAVLGQQREGAVNFAHALRVATQNARPRLVGAHVENAVGSGVGEVNNSFNVLVHETLLL